MFETIERLRQKPERTKKRVAFLVAFCFAGIIFVIWLSVVYPAFRESGQNEQKVSSSEPSPLSTFEDTLSTGFSAITDQFKLFKSSISSLTQNINTQSSAIESLISTTTKE